jgi:hypothetical protein
MILMKVLLLLICFGALTGAVGTVIYDIFLAFELDRILRRGEREEKSLAGGTQLKLAQVASNAPIATIAPAARIESGTYAAAHPRRANRWNVPPKFARVTASGKK